VNGGLKIYDSNDLVANDLSLRAVAADQRFEAGDPLSNGSEVVPTSSKASASSNTRDSVWRSWRMSLDEPKVYLIYERSPIIFG
jgi:hypothetical protein